MSATVCESIPPENPTICFTAKSSCYLHAAATHTTPLPPSLYPKVLLFLPSGKVLGLPLGRDGPGPVRHLPASIGRIACRLCRRTSFLPLRPSVSQASSYLDSLYNSSSDPLGNLRQQGVSERLKSVHPSGYPMRYSTKITLNFPPTWSFKFRERLGLAHLAA